MPDSILNLYRYDALNRQVGCTPSQQSVIQRFHCKSRLATELQDAVCWSIVQYDEQLLALQLSPGTAPSATLLATDQQRSVLHALSGNQSSALAYTAYGHHPAQHGLLSLLGFNGERPDPVTGHYHLGNGYRQFNPVLMCFNSPDNVSPFGEGGLNAYGYCDGDPINRRDPTGHASIFKLLTPWKWKRFAKPTAEMKKANIESVISKIEDPYVGKHIGYDVKDKKIGSDTFLINSSKVKLRDNKHYQNLGLRQENFILEATRRVKINSQTGTYKVQPIELLNVKYIGDDFIHKPEVAKLSNKMIQRFGSITPQQFHDYKQMPTGKLKHKIEELRRT